MGQAGLRVAFYRPGRDMARRTLEAVIYERDPADRASSSTVRQANTQDATLVREVDDCLHKPTATARFKVVIIKSNGNGFCVGHVARLGPDTIPTRMSAHVRGSLQGTPPPFLVADVVSCWSSEPTICAYSRYAMGGGSSLVC